MKPLVAEARALVVALELLTRIPVPVAVEATPSLRGRSLHWYPLVGLILGLLLAAVAALLPVVPLMAAVVLVAVWVLLTGGLHLDGLADSADAWVGGMGDRERTLAIMKDPACGPAGVVALVLVLLAKVAALAVLLAQGFVPWWLVPMAARGVLPLAFVALPYVRSGGMGASLAEQAVRPAIAVAAGIVLLLLALFLPGALWWWWLAVSAVLFWCWRRGQLARIDGFTGDGAGALVELLETALLLAAALWLGADLGLVAEPGSPGVSP